MQNTEMLEEFLGLAADLGLQNTSYGELQEEVRNAVLDSGVIDVERVLESLKGYRVVQPDSLAMHQYIRWIRKGPKDEHPKLVVGGVVTSVTEQDNGESTIKCVNKMGRFFQVTTRPDVILFRLFSDQEVVVLNVLEALDQRSMQELQETEEH